MIDNSVSIVMPVHDQDFIIDRVMKGILSNSSENVKELLIIVDGCTDNSEKIILENLNNKRKDMDAYLWYAPNIFEVLACNIGFKFSHCKYSLNVQDDMVLGEKDFDKRLMKPFEALSNIFAVTARDAVDVKIVGEKIDYYNGAGKDSHTPRNMFSIRDIINRGPILFDNEKLKELGYLNEYFYPMGQDDTEICLRAYRKGWLVGSYGAEYESRMEWGHTRRFVEICHLLEESEKKNMKRIIELHSDIINLPKHDKDIIIK